MPSSENKNSMLTGNPTRAILIFAIPLFIGNVFQQFYNAADSIIVGRFVSAQALAAVGACSSSYNLMIAVINGFTSGASVVIAQSYGSGDRDGVRRSYITSWKILLVSGLIFTVLGLLLGGSLLHLLGTPDDVFADSMIYMNVMCAGILATCLYNGMAAFLRSVGDSVTPLVALIISSILNIVLDMLFVLAFGMGVSGVAIATLISQLVSGLYCLFVVKRKMPELSFSLSEFKIDPVIGKEMVRIGLPATFSTAVVTVSVMFIQRAVNTFGSTVMAAYTAGSKTETICFCLAFSIGLATGIFCGQNLGAGQQDRVHQGFYAGIRISLIYTVITGALVFFLAKPILSLFTTDTQVIDIGYHMVRITGCFAPVLGIVFILQNFLRNVSDVQPTVIMSFAEIFSRGLLPFVLSSWLGYYGIWWATPVGWTLSFLIGFIRYKSGKWIGKASIGQKR